MKTKKMEVGDFRSLFSGRTVYKDLLPVIVGMIMVRTQTTYAATMRALLRMDGKFAFKIVELGRMPQEQRLEMMATKIDEFRSIIFPQSGEVQTHLISQRHSLGDIALMELDSQSGMKGTK